MLKSIGEFNGKTVYNVKFDNLTDLYDYLKSNPEVNKRIFVSQASIENEQSFSDRDVGDDYSADSLHIVRSLCGRELGLSCLRAGKFCEAKKSVLQIGLQYALLIVTEEAGPQSPEALCT